MTEIAFHFGAADTLAYTARLLRKALTTGARLTVLAEPAMLQRLSQGLWAVSPTDFVAHAQAGDAQAVLARSPVYLCGRLDAKALQQPILVNLQDAFVQEFQSFMRVVEVVGAQDDERAAARARWKQYTAMGFSIQKHDLSAKAGAA